MHLTLKRFSNHPTWGTLGELYLDNKRIAYSIEQPWNDNKPFKSCVPAGIYELKTWDSEKHPDTFALFNPALDVYVNKQADSSRYACLIHPANWAHDVQGCIGFGHGIAFNDGLMVTHSSDTVKFVKEIIRNNDINRLIIEKIYQ